MMAMIYLIDLLGLVVGFGVGWYFMAWLHDDQDWI